MHSADGQRLSGPSILVVNANTSAAATAIMRERGSGYASPGTRVEFATADAGPEGIDTPLDLALAAVEVAKIVAREAECHDAFVVACGGDPGVDAARTITACPVVGIAEAAMLFVRPSGMRFTVLTTLDADAPGIQAMAQRYGVADRFAGVAALGEPTAELVAAVGSDGLAERMEAVCAAAVRAQHADVLVLPGAVMLGFEQHLSESLGIPVLTGLGCGIKLAEAMAGLGIRTSRRHRYGHVEKGDRLIGYPEFQAAYGRRASPEG